MSTTSKFMERYGQRVRTRDVVPVSSGSPVRLSLSFLHGANTPEAARILVKRQLPLRTAHAILTEMVDHGNAFVTVPCVDDLLALKNELSSAGVIAKVHAPRPISVREVRDRTKLSQEAFSVRGPRSGNASKLGARSLETGCSGQYSPLDHRPESGSSRRIAGHGGRSGCPFALRGPITSARGNSAASAMAGRRAVSTAREPHASDAFLGMSHARSQT